MKAETVARRAWTQNRDKLLDPEYWQGDIAAEWEGYMEEGEASIAMVVPEGVEIPEDRPVRVSFEWDDDE